MALYAPIASSNFPVRYSVCALPSAAESGGFVTAYAHASKLMVKVNDQVRRGQVIAKSGQTGSVTAPQLHFEMRKGATPVDPLQYLPKG